MRASMYPLVDAAAAAALVLEHTPVLGIEQRPLDSCAGRVLAEDVVAPSALPAFRSSAVDGFALRSTDAGQTLRVIGESAAGRPYEGRVGPGTAARILTGGTQLGAAEIGIAAAIGRALLPVRRRPRVALMSTGDELVEVGKAPGRGQITDSNRWALYAALLEAGADVHSLGIAPDEPGELRRLVEEWLDGADVLVTSGGVSVGTHDLVKPLLESLGTVHVGRVKLKPGKPFTFATLPAGKLAFGLPGFPVSSLVTFEVFVRIAPGDEGIKAGTIVEAMILALP